MRRFVAGCMLAVGTFAGGWYVGTVSAVQDADAKAVTPHQLDLQNAKRYADWCGGYVQVVPFPGGEDITVQGCDR